MNALHRCIPSLLIACPDRIMPAQRHEVQWIERLHLSYTHNRSGRGVCETGTRLNSPMDSVGIRGGGEVIGVVDTGIDVKSCFFSDSNPVPYILVSGSDPTTLPTTRPTTRPSVSSSHRKIAAYYYQSTTDKFEDCTGHGTHTAGSPSNTVIISHSSSIRHPSP